MEHPALEIRLKKTLLLQWFLLSVCLHGFLLLLPVSSPLPEGRPDPHELRVIAAMRANFVPDSPLPQQVDLRRPDVFSPKPSGPSTPRLKSQAPRAASSEAREPVVYEPTLRLEPVSQMAAQKKSVTTQRQPEAALLIAAFPSARPKTAAPNISASEVKPPQHPAAADVSLASRDAIPRYAENPLPVYPEIARRKGWRGEVLLLVSVTLDGIVERLRVQQSSGFRILDRAALKAVKNWRFYPASRAGRAVDSEILVPVEFHLSQSI